MGDVVLLNVVPAHTGTVQNRGKMWQGLDKVKSFSHQLSFVYLSLPLTLVILDSHKAYPDKYYYSILPLYNNHGPVFQQAYRVAGVLMPLGDATSWSLWKGTSQTEISLVATG